MMTATMARKLPVSASEPLRPEPTALATRLLAVNGHVMGWHPVLGLPAREVRV